MERLSEFEVKFSGLKEGVHRFEFSITDKFFEEFEYEDFNSVKAAVELILHKKPTLMEAHLSMQGQINLNCEPSPFINCFFYTTPIILNAIGLMFQVNIYPMHSF